MNEIVRAVLQNDFDANELAMRREAIFDEIGEASALIKGAVLDGSGDFFRQHNEFYYLCGVERPHSYLLLDGKARTSTLFMTERTEHEIRDQGPSVGLQDAEEVRHMSGVQRVLGLDQLSSELANIKTLYVMFRPGENRVTSHDNLTKAAKASQADPLDQRPNEADHLKQMISSLVSGIEFKDLYTIISEMRIVKSPAEIEVMRQAGELTAQAVVEAMKSTVAGIYEYHLYAAAEYLYRMNGARGYAYTPIIATGDNIWHTHYHKCHSELKDGELVLMDFAPDVRYYTSDIGRFWPVNGAYSERQRLLYSWVVDYHKCLLELIRPGVTADEIESEAAAIMVKRLDAMTKAGTFEDEADKRGFYQTLETRHLTHGVGMAVHESGRYRKDPLRPGVVIALDPQMWIPEKECYIRVEDTVIVTESGVENVTSAAPLELDDVERIVGTGGMLQQFPPLTSCVNQA